ncbi:hypothetical protein P4606_19840 [Priestia aryabhattai]|uniref:hypothetical protein n=1 Tax=Priestia aryabhattai TaxID=412384 RepID=UPI002E1DB805|nr:hypothetical protein [Priestia aryabhattai]
MKEKKNLDSIKSQINQFKMMFKENPVEEIKSGSWFTKILQLVLEDSRNLSAEYFVRKYIGLDKESIARRLIKTTSNYTAITGGLAGAAASAAELSTLVSGGWSLAAAGAVLIGEISYITYLQLKLIYEISVIYNAKLDRNDPEDLITIFWYSLGINKWEEASNAILKAGPRSTEYLGRKALRSGLRKSIQNVVGKLGGQKLARKITEKALLKFIVPGINIPIAASVNKVFTKKLGNNAVKTFKRRSITLESIDKLKKFDRHFQLLSIPLIYHIGIFDQKNKIDKVVEMQNTVVKYLNINSGEEEIIDDLISINFEDFCEILSEIDDKKISKILGDIMVYSYHLTGSTNDEKKLQKLFHILSLDFSKIYIETLKKEII